MRNLIKRKADDFLGSVRAKQPLMNDDDERTARNGFYAGVAATLAILEESQWADATLNQLAFEIKAYCKDRRP